MAKSGSTNTFGAVGVAAATIFVGIPLLHSPLTYPVDVFVYLSAAGALLGLGRVVPRAGSALWVLAVLSAAISGTRGGDLKALRWVILTTAIVVTVASIGSREAKHVWGQLGRGVALGSALTAVLVLLHRGTALAANGLLIGASEPHALLPYYTVCGGLLALGSVWNLSRAVNSSGNTQFLWSGLALLTFAGVLGTHSRGGLAGAAGGCAMTLLLQRTWAVPRRLITIFGGVALGVVAALVLFPGTVARFTHPTLTSLADQRRAIYQHAGREVVLRNPLGIGYGSFSRAAATLDTSSAPVVSHAHQTFLQMSLDLGIAGSVAILLLMAWAFLTSIAISQNPLPTVPAYIAPAVAGTIVAIAVQGANDYLYYYSGIWVADLIVVGVWLECRRRALDIGDDGGKPTKVQGIRLLSSAVPSNRRERRVVGRGIH